MDVNREPGSVVASVLGRLRTAATLQGVPFNQVLQSYVIERFLHRLSKTKHVEGVLLKGALLLKTLGLPRARPTLDIDLLRRGPADRHTLMALVRDCALIEDHSDGMTFEPTTIVAQDMPKDALHAGMRIEIAGRVQDVRLTVQIDFDVGDVVVPEPRLIEYPALLDPPVVRLRAYPVEAIIAEKFHAIVKLDVAKSGMKDFYDIWACSRHLQFDGAILARSLASTFANRASALPTQTPLALTASYFEAESHWRQWLAFVTRISEVELVDQFAHVLATVADFVMPPARAAANQAPFNSRWRPGGPWSD